MEGELAGSQACLENRSALNWVGDRDLRLPPVVNADWDFNLWRRGFESHLVQWAGISELCSVDFVTAKERWFPRVVDIGNIWPGLRGVSPAGK